MSKAHVIGQYTRHLRTIATIEQVERPRLTRRLASARRALAELDRLTFLDPSLVDRLRREVADSLSGRRQ